jgi:hypothetical protein
VNREFWKKIAMTEDIVDALRNLIAYFVERQRLVVLAMLDVHPFALKVGGSCVFNIDLAPYMTAYHDRESTATSSLQRGIWKGQWEYSTWSWM